MNSDVARDLSWSAKAFVDLVWPMIREHLGGGELVPAEAVMDERMSKDFDMLAGIDAWQVCRPGGIRGIASRVQKGKKAWNTFTIRYARTTGTETEYSKRMRAIEHSDMGWLLPHITVQAYVTNELDRLLSCAVVRTKDLFCFAAESMREHDGKVYMQENRYDGNAFIVAPWDVLAANDILVIVKEPVEAMAQTPQFAMAAR